MSSLNHADGRGLCFVVRPCGDRASSSPEPMRKVLFGLIAPVAVLSIACDPITDPGGDPVSLSVGWCAGSSEAPTWLAVQDGDGQWARVTPVNGVFDFELRSGRGGLATHTAGDGLLVIYATTEEFQQTLTTCTAPAHNVSGTVAGYAFSDGIELWMGGASYFISGSTTAPAPYLLEGVNGSSTDLIAHRYRTTATTTTFERTPSRVALRRGVGGTDGGAIDFSSTEATAALERSLSITNVAVGEALSITSYIAMKTSSAAIAEYFADNAVAAGATLVPFYGIAGSLFQSGETHQLIVEAFKELTVSSSEQRVAGLVFTDPVDRAVTLGPVLGPISLSGSAHPSATYTVQQDYDGVLEARFVQEGSAGTRTVDVVQTRGYGGNTSSVTVSVPNLSGVSGYSSSWQLSPGLSTGWGFAATNAGLSLLNSSPQSYIAAIRSGLFTP